MTTGASTCSVEPLARPQKNPPRTDRRAHQAKRPRQQSKYHVILWNDDDHTFTYVIRMLQELFGYSTGRGWQMANEVHYRGKVILLTTTKEHAELKRDQVHAYGRDGNVRRCHGSMSVTIEPDL